MVDLLTVMVVVIVIVTIMVIVIVACKTLVTVSAPSNDLITVPGSLSVYVSAMSNHYPGLWVLFPCPYHHPVQSPSRSQSAFPLSLSLICFVLILVSGRFSLVTVSAPSSDIITVPGSLSVCVSLDDAGYSQSGAVLAQSTRRSRAFNETLVLHVKLLAL